MTWQPAARRWAGKNSKYNSEKTTVQGIEFDSKSEAQRYCELKLLEKANIIKDLQLQVPFELQPTFRKRGVTYRAINYIADFVYVEDGVTVVEDRKGFKTSEYLMKKKMFEYKYPALTLRETKTEYKRKTTKVHVKVTKPQEAGNKKHLEGQQLWK